MREINGKLTELFICFQYITLYINSTQLCQSLQDIFTIFYDLNVGCNTY